MSKRFGTRKRKCGLLAAAVGLILFVVGPCANLQYPPSNTQTYAGVALALG